MSAIAKISSALGYDACEEMLAAGMSLSAVYAFASVAVASTDEEKIDAPESKRPTMMAATVRPGKVT